MRIVDVVIDREYADALCEAAEACGHRWHRTSTAEDRVWLRVLVEQGDPDELLDDLRARLRREQDGDEEAREGRGLLREHYVVSEALAVEPHRDVKDGDEESEVGSDEVESFVSEGRILTRSFVILSVLSGVLAAGGLILDNSPVLVGAMVLAPLFKPLGLTGVAVLLGQPRRALRGLMCTGVSLALAAGVGALVALVTPGEEMTAALEARTGIRPFDLVIALSAGAAMAYALTKKDSMAMIGIVVAASILPVSAALGVSAALLDGSRVLGALYTLSSNLCGIVLGLIAALRLRQLGGLTRNEEREGKIWSRRSLVGGSLIALGLVSVAVWTYRGGTERRSGPPEGAIGGSAVIAVEQLGDDRWLVLTRAASGEDGEGAPGDAGGEGAARGGYTPVRVWVYSGQAASEGRGSDGPRAGAAGEGGEG